MPNLSLLLGLAAAAGVLAWSLFQPGATTIFDMHGLVIVIGGAAAAMLISTPAGHLFSALRTFLWTLIPGKLPSADEVTGELLRLSRKARAEGGLLALRDESPDFAGGFLKRALSAAQSSGETAAARDIIELEIKRRRVQRTEDANVFRTLGLLAPMFGLLGTLIGMLRVLQSMTEPTKLGPAMALALSSAFIGIALANFLCVPIAGQIRLLSMRETQMLEMILEGVLEIAANRPTYIVQLKLEAFMGRPAAAAAGDRG
ncbi:MAG: MotA/TolQ/ExbB proton channel family protein [Elusimicrobiota bacterium]|nr:MotA/TolQ/ExbB proton channel family protein [Elusimicrobiota bacterium]